MRSTRDSNPSRKLWRRGEELRNCSRKNKRMLRSKDCSRNKDKGSRSKEKRSKERSKRSTKHKLRGSWLNSRGP